MTPSVELDRPASPWRGFSWFAAAVVVALLPVLPLTLGGGWYLSDENAADATAAGRRFAVAMLVAGIAPFVTALLVPLITRAVTRSWGRAFRVAAIVVFVLDAFAWAMAMVAAAV